MIWYLLDKLIIIPSHIITMIERVVWERKIQGIIKKQTKDLHKGSGEQ